MDSKKIVAVMIIVLIFALVFFVRLTQENYVVEIEEPRERVSGSSAGVQGISITADKVDAPPSTSVPTSELALHNSLEDCWIAYDGVVYDITSFLPNHPGSAQAIVPYCGTHEEFSEAFEDQHGTSKVKNLMRVGVVMGDFDIMGDIA